MAGLAGFEQFAGNAGMLDRTTGSTALGFDTFGRRPGDGTGRASQRSKKPRILGDKLDTAVNCAEIG
jgi:hypothetical protein